MRAYGSISARGGALGGDGGLIETSGHWLDVAGISVNASATNGKSGTWLLDPADVTISGSAGVDTGGVWSGGVFTPNPSADTANVSSLATGTLVTALTAGTNVTINTANASGSGSGDINVNAAITWTSGTTLSTLNLIALRNVVVNSAITATKGSLVAYAGNDIKVYNAITVTNGSITLCAQRDVEIFPTAAITTKNNGAPNAALGNFTAIAGRDVNIDQAAALTTTNGSVLLSAGYDNTGGPGGLIGGTVYFAGPKPQYTVTEGALSTIIVNYTPTSYNPAVPQHDYSADFTVTGHTPVNAHMS